MIRLKTPQEIETLAQAGEILARILDDLEGLVKIGTTSKELDTRARALCEEYKVRPAFLGYAPSGHAPYPAAVCVSVNNEVVHGIPTDIMFEDGDIVGIDMGIVLNNMYVDSARTVPVGSVSAEVQQLLDVTKESLRLGIAAAQVGNTTGHIGEAIETYIEPFGFGIVRQLVGHGVGHGVHEEPQVPNYGSAGEGVVLEEGLVIAIEPMVTMGDPYVVTAEDEWTIMTEDGSLAAHEEHTIAITAEGPRILTTHN